MRTDDDGLLRERRAAWCRAVIAPTSPSKLHTFLVALCVLALDVHVAHAQTSEVAARLSYARESGAETCPDEPGLIAAVHTQLGYPAFENDPPTRVVTVTVRRARDRFVARLALASIDGAGQGSREIESRGATCDELAQALTLAISLALDATPHTPQPAQALAPPPLEEAPQPAIEPEAVVETPLASNAPPSAAPEELVDPESQHPLHWNAGAGPALGVGLLPGLTPGVALRVGLQVEWLEVVVGGAYYFESAKDLGSTTLQMQAWYARLAACGWFVRQRVAELAVCASGTSGSLHGGNALAAGRSATAIAAFGTGLALRTHLFAPFWLEMQGAIHINLAQTTLSLPSETLWETPIVFGEFGLFIVVLFS